MESMETILDQMKVYLTHLNYPNIEICAEDDIVQIFAPQNRVKLLLWCLNQLSDSIAIPLDEVPQMSYMSDIIHEWGFCQSSEKTAFVKGELEVPQQFAIFSRLFWCLVNKKSSISSARGVDFANIKTMVEYSSNLKKRVQSPITLEAHENRRKQTMDKINLIQKEIDSSEKIEDFALPDLKDLNIDGFEDDLVTFSTNSGIILGCNSAVAQDSVNTLQLKDLDSVNEILEHTVKHLKNIKTISEHKTMLSFKKSLNEDNDKWFQKNFERLERMLHKCQTGKGPKS